MTSSTTVIILSVICTLIAIVIGAPTTYDERQDGDWNVRAKLENIMIVVAIPPKTVTDQVANSQLTGYLTMLAAAQAMRPDPQQYDITADTTNADTTEPSKADELDESQYDKDAEDLFGLFTDDDDLKKLKIQPSKSSEKLETGEEVSASGVRPKARNLWGQVEDVVHNRQGASLKKELSWGQDEDAVLPAADGIDEHSRSNDHNEVGLITNSHLTLIGGNTEDCGPDRVRNSYGICQALPSK